MIPIDPELEGLPLVTYGKDQPDYKPLPARVLESTTFTCWKLSLRERLVLLLTGKLYLSVLTFGTKFPPIHLDVIKPLVDYPPSGGVKQRLK